MSFNIKKHRTCILKTTECTGPLTDKERKMLAIKQALQYKDNLDEAYCEFHINKLFDYCVCNRGQCDELPCISDIDFK